MSGSFYLEPGAAPIDWESSDTLVLANPEWIRRQAGGLAGHRASSARARRAHLGVHVGHEQPRARARAVDRALEGRVPRVGARGERASRRPARPTSGRTRCRMFHVGGLGILARGPGSNGARVVPAVVGKWSASGFLDAVGRESARRCPRSCRRRFTTWSPPGSPRRRRCARSSSAARGWTPRSTNGARALGWPCLPSYGLTETCSQVATAALVVARRDRPSDGAAGARPRGDPRRTTTSGCRFARRRCSPAAPRSTSEGARAWDPKQDGWLATEDTGRVGPTAASRCSGGSRSR